VNQLDAVGLREMLAFLRKYVVALVQIVSGQEAYGSLIRDFFSSSLRGSHHDQVATHTLEAETLRAKTQRKHAAALAAWQPSELPEWLNEEAYRTKIQPALARITIPAIATALGISEP
jgi:hypothetical protein